MRSCKRIAHWKAGIKTNNSDLGAQTKYEYLSLGVFRSYGQLGPLVFFPGKTYRNGLVEIHAILLEIAYWTDAQCTDRWRQQHYPYFYFKNKGIYPLIKTLSCKLVHCQKQKYIIIVKSYFIATITYKRIGSTTNSE